MPLPWQLLSCYKFHNAIRNSELPSFHLWTLLSPLCQFLKESCTHWHQTDKPRVDQTGDEFLGPNRKHLASTDGTANPSAVTNPQLCLLPIAAWQRLWVAFRQTWITQMPKILWNSCLQLEEQLIHKWKGHYWRSHGSNLGEPWTQNLPY